jgi:hypothetical protein
MAFLEDMAEYVYAPEFVRPGTKAVGWLARGHPFPTATPDEEILDLLWLYCSVSVARARGGHDCEFCPSGSAYEAERRGQQLLLSTAEIRVLSPKGEIYAAPTLIYHYVAVHHYKPPDEFLQALREGPRPPSREYFDALTKLKLEWSRTSRGDPKDRVFLNPCPGTEGRNYLDTIGTLQDIARIGVNLEDGLIVRFYHPRIDTEKNRNDLLFEGAVHFDATKKKWFATVDEKSFRAESDLETRDHDP